MISKVSNLLKIHLRQLATKNPATLPRGPTFFNDPATIPSQYNARQSTESMDEVSNLHQMQSSSLTKRSFKDFSSFIAIATLAYLALDNYEGRVKAEKLNQETTAINVKTLKIQLQNYLKARQQQDLRMLKERAEVSKRCFKMSMHIALLRKQLIDLGVDPRDISDVTQEFDRSARVSSSVQNLTGNAIWLTDESEFKGLMPDYRDYDRKN